MSKMAMTMELSAIDLQVDVLVEHEIDIAHKSLQDVLRLVVQWANNNLVGKLFRPVFRMKHVLHINPMYFMK